MVITLNIYNPDGKLERAYKGEESVLFNEVYDGANFEPQGLLGLTQWNKSNGDHELIKYIGVVIGKSKV